MRVYSCMADGILPEARDFSAARMAFALSKPIRDIVIGLWKGTEVRGGRTSSDRVLPGPAVYLLVHGSHAPASEVGQFCTLAPTRKGCQPTPSLRIYAQKDGRTQRPDR